MTGTSKTYVNDKIYELMPGDIIAIPPNTSHKEISENSFTDMYFSVSETAFSDTCIVHDQNDTIRTLLQILHRTYIEKGANYQLLSDSIAETILQFINKFSHNKYKYQFTQTLADILYANINNCDFKIKDCIKQMGYDSDYFRRCFYNDTNQTPLEYLTNLRIESAKMLLRQKYFISIQETALRCGFKDQFYFSKKFKQKVGLSPLKYKKTLPQ